MKFWQRAEKAGLLFPVLPNDVLTKTFDGSKCVTLDGQALAKALIAVCSKMAKEQNLQPKLAVVLAGEDPASQVYVANKTKMFAEAGFPSETICIPSHECTLAKLFATIDRLNEDNSVHGILVQLPLPKGINSADVLARIRPEKDVDGFLPQNVGLLATDNYTGALPCTPFGMMALLKAYGISVAGKNAVVIGRSNIVGKPMALLLLGEDATVTLAHSKSLDLPALCSKADIIVAAAGQRELVRAEFVKPGAVILDVGIHRTESGKLCGDVQREVTARAAALSPVPKGVGPMTIAMLLVNTLLASRARG
jgi:methylenetetrahydrofolate dehydrogenase (NADP+)/methenyltetrahydrofolate cyclohydrolase